MEQQPVDQEPAPVVEDAPDQEQVGQQPEGGAHHSSSYLAAVGNPPGEAWGGWGRLAAPQAGLLLGPGSGVGEVLAQVLPQGRHLQEEVDPGLVVVAVTVVVVVVMVVVVVVVVTAVAHRSGGGGGPPGLWRRPPGQTLPGWSR